MRTKKSSLDRRTALPADVREDAAAACASEAEALPSASLLRCLSQTQITQLVVGLRLLVCNRRRMPASYLIRQLNTNEDDATIPPNVAEPQYLFFSSQRLTVSIRRFKKANEGRAPFPKSASSWPFQKHN